MKQHTSIEKSPAANCFLPLGQFHEALLPLPAEKANVFQTETHAMIGSTNVLLQPRDRQLLHALVFAVRFFVVRQVAELWRADLANVRKRMKKLIAAGFIETRTICAQPIPPIRSPLCRWKPGQEIPLPGQVAYAAKKRFRNRTPRSMTALKASTRTLHLFGCATRARLKTYQHTHDLGLSETYVFFYNRWPRLTHHWIGEDAYAAVLGHGQEVEDAQLLHPRSRVTMLAIEYTGHYRRDRVASLIEALVNRNVAFMCF